MDPTSASSSSKSSNPLGTLQRGKACLNCRRRKMKCDGVRPVCGPCSRANRPDDCEYTDGQGRTRTQILEENIAQLQARIQELENPDSGPPPVTLHDPHSRGFQTAPSPSGGIHSPSSSRSTQPPHSSGTSSPVVGEFQRLKLGVAWQSDPESLVDPHGHTSSEVWWDADEPPTVISQQLLEHFFRHASQLGWFLNVLRFRHSVLLAPGNVNRPIPALMNTVYLWGSSFSRHAPDGDLSAHENMFLQRALSQMGHALSGAPSHQVLQAVQAKILLSLYYYCAGNFIAGRHQSDSAASLVLACGLHKIRSAQVNQQTSSYVDHLPIALVEARDQVEEGERINAMWTAFSIDRCWAVAFGAPSLISDSDALGTQIDTPWPLDMETYETGQIFPNLRTSCTLRNFLAGINTGWPWENQSLLAQVGKVSALFERATHLAECWRPGTTVSADNEELMNMFFSSSEIPNMNTFYTNFVSIDQRIAEFKTQLYPLDNLEHVAPDVVRTVHTIHCLANAASIQLHAAFAQQNAASRLKCLDSARAIVRANAAARAYEFSVVNPILGTLWAAACQVFIRELVALRSYPLQAGPVTAEQDAELRSSLDQLEAVMAIFAPVCALFGYQLSKVQQERLGL